MELCLREDTEPDAGALVQSYISVSGRRKGLHQCKFMALCC